MWDRESGSIVASHALVSILIVFIALGLLQLAGALYVRAIVTDAAAAGARKAALVYSTPADGQARVRELVARAAPGVEIAAVRVGEEPIPGLSPRRLIRVEVDATLPLIGPWGMPAALHSVGHAVKEEAHE